MPSFTPNLNLYKPGGGSTGLITPDEVVDIDRLNQNFDLIDSAVKSVQDRATSLENRGGLQRVIPSAVTGHSNATVDASGVVRLAAVPGGSVLKLEGLFSSTFRHYEVLSDFSIKPAVAFGSGSTVQGLIGSSPVTVSMYSYARQGYVGGTRTDAQGTGQTNFSECFALPQGSVGGSALTIFSPNEAQPTFIRAQLLAVGGITADVSISSALNDTSALTGLQVTLASGGNWTGELRIYGVA